MYKRILTVQDISCVGQCSLTVALPLLSACGLETAILPSAVLSTHTAGFKGYTFRDLTEDMPKIADHWRKEKIDFEAIYTGYLGSAQQIAHVIDLMRTTLVPGGRTIVDPAMADNGKLYPGFDAAFVAEMRKLCAEAQIILPNITEACQLTGDEYRETYDEAWIDALLANLTKIGAKTVVLTGVGYTPDTTGVVTWDGKEKTYYRHRRIAKGSHGTGDVYASIFAGALVRGLSVEDAARLAADMTVLAIERTVDDASHWYGAKFELVIPDLVKALSEKAPA